MHLCSTTIHPTISPSHADSHSMDASTATTTAAAAAASISANLQHMCRFEAKLPPAALPQTAVTQAFGAWAYPKIVAGLRSDNAVIQAKSIVAARELLVAPEKHIQSIAAGITPALRDLLSAQPTAAEDSPAAAAASNNTPADTQAAAATTLQLLVSKEVGCRDALQHGCLPPLLQLLKQPSAAVRDAAYGCLRAAALFEPWRAALVREGALPALLMYAQQEEPQRAAHALELLHHCTQVWPEFGAGWPLPACLCCRGTQLWRWVAQLLSFGDCDTCVLILLPHPGRRGTTRTP